MESNIDEYNSDVSTVGTDIIINDDYDSDDIYMEDNNITKEENTNNINYIEPILNRLTFLKLNQCIICYKSKKCKEYHLLPLYGWYYCEDCKEIANKQVIAYLNYEKCVPLNWIISSDKYGNKDDDIDEIDDISCAKFLNFFRLSQKGSTKEIYQAKLTNYSECGNLIRFSDTCSAMTLGVEFYQEHKLMIKSVSLANIFAHNPTLYKDLVSCQNLLDCDDFVISYSDLSEEIHQLVEYSYKDSLRDDLRTFKF